MCGIAGILSTDAGPPAIDAVAAMLSALEHRGPDGSGIYRDEQVGLGHTRLAIIDLAGGAQPMSNPDETIWVTFNGEIFNHVELRQELTGLGHQFGTVSDTEVIIHAWEQWGPDCFARFNGQWALALWETRTKRLILSRDRLGVRPLYLTHHGGQLRFASEVKALFTDPELPRAFDPVGLRQTMTFWSTVAPRTVFAGVEQLPPGHLAIFTPGQHRIIPYWQPDFPEQGQEEPQDFAANAAAVRERVVDATRLRFLRSDVPVGAYLSGGIDSAITAAVIARHTDAALQTFSLRFADADFDEGSFQHDMAARLGTEHHEVTVSASDIATVFPEVVAHAETPILRAAPAPMFLLSALVAEHGVKVVVTGEGADEVFAGYDIFREDRVRRFVAADPDSAVRARALELLYPWMVRSPGQAPSFAREFFGLRQQVDDPAFSHRPRWDTTSALLGMTTLAGSPAEVVEDVLADLPANHTGWDPLSRAQWWELHTLLPGYLLSSQGDRMLMANSVEGRFPFLDHDVVAHAGTLPARHKLLGLSEKHILKAAFADLVPEQILHRPKQPYRSPDAAAFFLDETVDSWVSEVTSPEAVEAAGVFTPGAVQALLAKGRRTRGVRLSNTDNMRVLNVLSTQLLHHQFIAGAPSAPAQPTHHPAVLIDRLTDRLTGQRG